MTGVKGVEEIEKKIEKSQRDSDKNLPLPSTPTMRFRTQLKDSRTFSSTSNIPKCWLYLT